MAGTGSRQLPSRTLPGRARSLRASTSRALQDVGGALGTAVLALGAAVLLTVVAGLSLVGVGLLAVPWVLAVVRALAERERARLGRGGGEVLGAGAVPTGMRPALGDGTVRRELGWVLLHGTLGTVLGLVAVLLPLSAVRDLSFPLWWRWVPEGEAGPTLDLWTVTSWPSAAGVAALGLGWAALTVLVAPAVAGVQARYGRALLSPPADVDLPLRVAELTATRAAALDAHAAELRRIERSLHDGAQNRLVAVTVLLGAGRRALRRDPARADAVLGQAQDAAEAALAELRAVSRTILPPVLEDRGLAGALAGLAAACPVPCEVRVDVAHRCAASVEATAYFVVAETLTNVARHSRASRAEVSVVLREGRLVVGVSDDGRGGAQEGDGSGLAGIRRRAEAHDGTYRLGSPPGGPTTVTVELPCGS